MELKVEAMPTSEAPSVHSGTSAFGGLGHFCIQDQSPFIIWVEPNLPFTLVRNVTMNGLWSTYHCIFLLLPAPRLFGVTELVDFGLYSWVLHIMVTDNVGQ